MRVSSVQAACHSWEGLMVCRFLLAIPEVMYGPAVSLYLSFFYPRERIGLRVACFSNAALCLLSVVGSLSFRVLSKLAN